MQPSQRRIHHLPKRPPPIHLQAKVGRILPVYPPLHLCPAPPRSAVARRRPMRVLCTRVASVQSVLNTSRVL